MVKCIKETSKDENGIFVKLVEGQETTPLHKGEPGKPCCCHWLLNQCEDFQNQKSHIQEIVEEAGHHCIFLPKFHPELNFIERFWGHVKRVLRENCSYSIKDLAIEAPKQLRTAVSLIQIRRYARHAGSWMAAYRLEYFGTSAAFAMKVFESHRGIPPTVDNEVQKQIEGKLEREK